MRVHVQCEDTERQRNDVRRRSLDNCDGNRHCSVDLDCGINPVSFIGHAGAEVSSVDTGLWTQVSV